MIISKLVNITTNRKWALDIYEQRKTERLTCVSVPLRNICYYFDPFFIESASRIKPALMPRFIGLGIA